MKEDQGDERLEIQVLQSDSRDLSLFDGSDLAFAILYGALFLWGLVLTLISL